MSRPFAFMAQKKVKLTIDQTTEKAVLDGIHAVCTAYPEFTRVHAARLIGEHATSYAFELARKTVSAELTAGAAKHAPKPVGLKPPGAPVLKGPVKAGVKRTARKSA